MLHHPLLKKNNKEIGLRTGRLVSGSGMTGVVPFGSRTRLVDGISSPVPPQRRSNKLWKRLRVGLGIRMSMQMMAHSVQVVGPIKSMKRNPFLPFKRTQKLVCQMIPIHL